MAVSWSGASVGVFLPADISVDSTRLLPLLKTSFATDLNLNRPVTAKPKSEQHARELLNRTRVWANCFNLDRSTSSWHGKSSTISNDDYVAKHMEEWYNASEYNLPNFDIHLACYLAELRKLGSFRAKLFSDPEHPMGLNKAGGRCVTLLMFIG